MFLVVISGDLVVIEGRMDQKFRLLGNTEVVVRISREREQLKTKAEP